MSQGLICRRPSWDEYFLNLCFEVGKRSTCDRGRNGCVISRENQIQATGYAGALPNLGHCDDLGHLLKTVRHEDGSQSTHCYRTVHAEQNAICQAAKFGVRLKGSILYCTMTPCRTCSMLIISTGIVCVVVAEKYQRASESEILFSAAGVHLSYQKSI